MILAASGITALVATLLMRARAFPAADQLTLRPDIEKPDEPASGHVDPSAVLDHDVV